MTGEMKEVRRGLPSADEATRKCAAKKGWMAPHTERGLEALFRGKALLAGRSLPALFPDPPVCLRLPRHRPGF